MAVLSEDEKDLGVCLVDIGGGTTDIAVFTHGAIRHTAVIPIAGDQITNDIAMALRTPTKDAEEIKIRQRCAARARGSAAMIECRASASAAAALHVAPDAGRGDRAARRGALFARATGAARVGLRGLLSSGVVLTGGSAVMQGMVELGEEIFHMPVRIGIPRYAGALAEVLRTPRYATAMGLLYEGVRRGSRASSRQSGSVKAVLGRMREWFQRNF